MCLRERRQLEKKLIYWKKKGFPLGGGFLRRIKILYLLWSNVKSKIVFVFFISRSYPYQNVAKVFILWGHQQTWPLKHFERVSVCVYILYICM